MDDPTADPRKGALLSTTDCISSLGLDTCFTHVIHVKEQWKIQVEIDAPGLTLTREFLSSADDDEIKMYAEKEIGLSNIKLFHEKKLWKQPNLRLGALSPGGTCKLFASAGDDKDRIRTYMNS